VMFGSSTVAIAFRLLENTIAGEKKRAFGSIIKAP